LEEKQVALEAVLGSEGLARSEHLRAFLRFVCEMEMAGRAAELTEYLIGVKALGRPEDFSPLEDSSVRSCAHDLRQRLQKYYASENPGALLRIDLHKGSYAPHFVSGRPAEHPEPDPLSLKVVAHVSDVRKPSPTRGWVGGFLAGIVVAAAGLALGTKASTPEVDSAVREAWAPVVASDPEVLICLAPDPHLEVSPSLVTVPQDTRKYPAPREMYASFGRDHYLPKGVRLEMRPVQDAVTMSSVQGLALALGILRSLGSHYRILTENDSPLRNMRGRNVVLLGSPPNSHAASTLLAQTLWTMSQDEGGHQMALIGRGPQAGKKFVPRRGPRNEYQEVFGLLSVLENDQTTDGGHTLILFSGLTSAGINGAAAFLASGPDLKNLGERFKREGLATWPRSYQVVIRCRVTEDAQLLSYAYETHQVIAR
jgi:hypothetical protein